MSKAPRLSDYAMLTLLSAIWGGSFMLIKVAVASLPAVPVTTGRLIVAAVFMVVFALLSRQRFVRGARNWMLIALVAVFGNALPFALISHGEKSVDSGLAAILMATMPLTTVLLAHIFTTDEKLNAWKFTGIVTGFAGLVVLIGPAKLVHLGDNVASQLTITSAAVCYGISALIVKNIKGVPQRSLTAGIMIVSALIMVPVCLYFYPPTSLSPTASSLWATLILGVLQTAVASLMAYSIIQKLGATFFSQLNFLVPFFGVAFGIVFLGEKLQASAFVALVIILTGVAIARYGILKSSR